MAGDPVSTGRMLNDSDDTEDVDMTGDCVFFVTVISSKQGS